MWTTMQAFLAEFAQQIACALEARRVMSLARFSE